MEHTCIVLAVLESTARLLNVTARRLGGRLPRDGGVGCCTVGAPLVGAAVFGRRVGVAPTQHLEQRVRSGVDPCSVLQRR